MRTLKKYQLVHLQGLPQRLVRQTFLPMPVEERQHLLSGQPAYLRRFHQPFQLQAHLLLQQLHQSQPPRRRRIRSSLRTARRLRKLRLALRLEFLGE